MMAKSLTATELRGYSVEELVGKLKEAKEELFNLRFQAATGQLDNNSRLRTVKREIARIYTVLREHELGIMPLAAEESADKTKEAAG
ncbi:large subunit ribosomal protein L29 [Thermobifida halotolerans]